MTVGSEEELTERAARHGVAFFEDRLILDARPPITEAEIREVEKRVGRPLPPGLLTLWRSAFGGSIHYALDIDFDGHVASFSLSELFYPGSDGYRDLWGWIDHELELAIDAGDAEAARGVLRYLPFGGFEYLDRLYVCLEDGPDHGAVFAWMQGLPPAWALRLHKDSVARIAPDIPVLFRMLALEADPFRSGEAGFDVARPIAEKIGETRTSDPDLADALAAKTLRSVLDWKAALEAGALASDARLRRLALRQAAAAGDVDLADRLAAQGCDLNERYEGGGNLLDHMLARGHDAAASRLIERGVDPSNAIRAAASAASASRIAELIALGARVDVVSARSAAFARNLDGAHLIVERIAELGGHADLGALAPQLGQAAIGEETSARRIEQGSLSSNLSPRDYRERADCLRGLQAHIERLLRS